MSDENQELQAHSASDFDVASVRELIHLVQESDISELVLERNGSKLHIKRHADPPPPMPFALPSAYPAGAPAAAPHPQSAATPTVIADATPAASEDVVPEEYLLKAPMVGTYYASPSPKEAVYINEGDEIFTGDTVCIIEAMKIMNEIESDLAGRVSKILVRDGQPVEFGQPLMVIVPEE